MTEDTPLPSSAAVPKVSDWRNPLIALYVPLCEGVGEGKITSLAGGSLLRCRYDRVVPSFVYNRYRTGNSKSSKITLPDHLREKMAVFISNNLGLDPISCRKFCALPYKTIEGIEQVIHGVFDSILTGLPWTLSSRSRHIKRIFIKCIRLCFHWGAYNHTYELLIKAWKNFATYVWVTCSKADVIAKPTIDINNPFYGLLKLPRLRTSLDKGIRNKRDCEMLAHLTSTRHMPPGGKISEKKAIQKFIATCSEEFLIKAKDQHDLELAARAVGFKIQHIMQESGESTSTETHVSLSSAGDIECPSSQGGRGARIRQALKLVLSVIPTETKMIELPCGLSTQEITGLPRWRTWFRTYPITFRQVDEDVGFGDPVLPEHGFKFVLNDRRWGFDEALGHQMLAVALLEAAEHGVFRKEKGFPINLDCPPIPSRISTIQEPGGKSRIITTTVWWNIILQQSLGHFLRRLLEKHPSAVDGLKRADQAWLLLNSLSQVRGLPEDYQILSSDLSEATDAIPTPLPIAAMVFGFLKGVGVTPTPLMEAAVVVAVSDREVRIHRGSNPLPYYTFIKKRGIFMGEPLAKGVLTILNLACEEDAMRRYLQPKTPELWASPYGDVSLVSDKFEVTPCPYVPWRCFKAGGDDHIAPGPREYLDFITENHLRWGSKISPEKHGVVANTSAVKYCEKVLYFKDADLTLSTKRINESLDSYNKSAFVDSVKVRLLTPHSVGPRDSQSDRNTAIGKGLSLGRTLRWLNSEIFTPYWVRCVRDRFIVRARSFVPKGRLLEHLKYPQVVGGLDLWLDDELISSWDKIPLATQCGIWGIINNNLSLSQRRTMSKFLSNNIRRGVDTVDTLSDILQEYGIQDAFYKLGLIVPKKASVIDLKKRFSVPYGMDPRGVLRLLQSKGYYTHDEIEEKVLRSSVFQSILDGKEVKMYNTEPWDVRYRKYWDVVFPRGYYPRQEGQPLGLPCPTHDEFKKLKWQDNFNSLQLYCISDTLDRVSTKYVGFLMPNENALELQSDPTYVERKVVEAQPTTSIQLLEQALPSLRISCLENVPSIEVMGQVPFREKELVEPGVRAMDLVTDSFARLRLMKSTDVHGFITRPYIGHLDRSVAPESKESLDQAAAAVLEAKCRLSLRAMEFAQMSHLRPQRPAMLDHIVRGEDSKIQDLIDDISWINIH